MIPLWKKELIASWENDSLAQELKTALMVDSNNTQGYQLIDGELRKEGKWYVGIGNQLRSRIIENTHNSAE